MSVNYADIHKATLPQPAARTDPQMQAAIYAGCRRLVLNMINDAILELSSPSEDTAENAYYFLMTDALGWLDLLGHEYDRQEWCRRVNDNDFRKVQRI